MSPEPKRGELRIPAFQRGFVWWPDDVAFLMDSIYKGYPFGSVLLWRTKVKLAQERDLGPFKVPEPEAEYPIDYVLDGQQRLTSILGVFATGLPRTNAIEWKDIYFDLESSDDSQSSQFSALSDSEVDQKKHFPLSIIFDSTAYRAATKLFTEEQAARVDDLQKKFLQVSFPYYMVETEEKDKIAIVFERINRKGIPLDTFQLLTAWTWSEEFELKLEFEELAAELEPFGFSDIGEDTDLLLRCAAAVIQGRESAESLLNVSGATVREALPLVKKGLRSAIDFLKENMNVKKLDNLPYPTSLIPLAAFFAGPEEEQFALTENQTKTLKEWFWRSAFAHRYSSGTKRNLEADIRESKKLRSEGRSNLGSFESSVSTILFSQRRFLTSSVDTKIFVLLLANSSPRSLVNGTAVSIGQVLTAGNRSEFHHIFPQAFLKKKGMDASQINVLSNFCILSASDNKKVGSKEPSKYKDKLAKEDLSAILLSNVIPEIVFEDDFEAFIEARSRMLVGVAGRLMGREKEEAPVADRLSLASTAPS